LYGDVDLIREQEVSKDAIINIKLMSSICLSIKLLNAHWGKTKRANL